jgi:hypothetical protein
MNEIDKKVMKEGYLLRAKFLMQGKQNFRLPFPLIAADPNTELVAMIRKDDRLSYQFIRDMVRTLFNLKKAEIGYDPNDR